MKILLVSNDTRIIDLIKNLDVLITDEIIIFKNEFDSIQILTSLITLSPAILIYDNDVSKDSLQILTSFRKLNNNTPIIFIASEINLEMGKLISQLGFYFTAVKPVSDSEITESLKSIKKNSSKLKII